MQDAEGPAQAECDSYESNKLNVEFQVNGGKCVTCLSARGFNDHMRAWGSLMETDGAWESLGEPEGGWV